MTEVPPEGHTWGMLVLLNEAFSHSEKKPQGHCSFSQVMEEKGALHSHGQLFCVNAYVHINPRFP